MSARVWGSAAWGVLAIAVLGGVIMRGSDGRVALAGLPERGREGFVGSGACKACHPGAYATWHDTFHRTMTRVADRDSIRGAFDGRVLPDGARPVADASGVAFIDAEGGRQPVVMVTGEHHLQVYWHASDDGSLRSAHWAWLVAEARFVPNDATLLHPPQEPVAYTWNRVCIKCHAVAGVPGWDENDARVRSQVAELGIACESCHGPGQAHVQAHRWPWSRFTARADDREDDTIVHPDHLSADESANVCGQCHSITAFHDEPRWLEEGRAHGPEIASWGALVRHPLRHSSELADTLLDEDPDFFAAHFWSDGMVRVSGRELSALRESRCATGGELSCRSCHSMHDAAPADQIRRDRGETTMCTSCHPDVDARAHGHHDPAQVSCLDCHMPHTTYGLLGAMRSHEIDAPQVEVALGTGRPLACNACHLDRTLAWSAEALARWYGQPIPDLPPESAPASLVGLLSGDAGQRALWAWHFGWSRAHAAVGGPWQLGAVARLLDDPYAAVRWVAWRALARAGVPMTDIDPADPHAVRAATARIGVADRPQDADTWTRIAATRDDRPVTLAE